jgi:hypothetical protein
MSLYLVFTRMDGDILNCRMATFSYRKAEQECLAAMRHNARRWTRIVEYLDPYVPVGTHVWVVLDDTSDVQIRGVHAQESCVPQDAYWVEDLVIV